MSGHGIGASVRRREDERFLRGRGQYVADFRFPGMREVAFVRSPVAHGRLRHVHVPAQHRSAVFTARDLTGVKPIRAATALPGFKHSSEPVLALDKLRYVGELVAVAVAPSRAQAEDIAASVIVDYEALAPVTDMLAARRPDTPLVHEDWGDNVFIEFLQGADARSAFDDIAQRAPIKVTREIRTARQCMLPIEGRAVTACWDDRLKFLTVISSTQMPHMVQRGLAECLSLNDGSVRVIAPDVGGGFGYKGLLCREEVVLAWLARTGGTPVRWVEDCREHLSANANCREHHYRITGYADPQGRLLALDCVAHVDAGAYSVYPPPRRSKRRRSQACCPGPTTSASTAAAPQPLPPTNARSFRIGEWRAAACALPSSSSWMRSRAPRTSSLARCG